MPVVAFIDLLGVRARWSAGGRRAAEAAFDWLQTSVASALRTTGSESVTGGGIETDSAAIVFDSTEDAASFIRELFSRTFAATRRPSDDRFWIRGTITSIGNADPLRRESALSGFDNIRTYRLEPGLLDAIAIEKSGFHGMRLVIEENLVTESVRRHFRLAVGSRAFIPFRKLANSVYPDRISDRYQDFLWMAREDESEWRTLKRAMANRLRWCAQVPAEFVQAAATQVVFNETVAIFRSLERRS
jgi:hypothetical protein